MIHGLTLVDVPKQCRAKYADLVVQVIAEVESAEPAMLAGDPLPLELAWMKFSVVDAMVLNSTRSPGESQMVVVNRRIRNFHAEQWETLWLEATWTSGNWRHRTSQLTPAEREWKLAAKVEALAAAGQAKRAAHAVATKGPPVADPGREADLLALFPKLAPRGVREAELPRAGRDLPPEWLTAQAVARARQMEASVADTIRSPNRLAKLGPMATRAEHLENLKHSEDGVERMASSLSASPSRRSRRLLSGRTPLARSLLSRSRTVVCARSSCTASTGALAWVRLPGRPRRRIWLRLGCISLGLGRGMAVLRPITPPPPWWSSTRRGPS